MSSDEVARVEHDYVIVGGGSAGCVLAARLGADPDVDVLLIERGAPYRRLELGIPLLGMRYAARYLEVLESSPQPHCLDRRLALPVANALGGGSSVNAMLYVRGEPRAYDRWAEQGAHGWDFRSVLPCFRRMEDFEEGASEYHGVGGPIGISATRYPSRFGRALVEACEERGLPRNHDFTGASQYGAGFYQFTQSNGERSSAAVGYLRAARARPNLHVLSRCAVDAVLFERGRAVGVRCRRAGERFTVRARREVVLAAGAVGTPRLLMLSGVGPADPLRVLGIAPVCDLPGVGEGLQDHPRCPVLFRPREPVSLSAPRLAGSLLQWAATRHGLFTSPTLAAGAFLPLLPDSSLLDLQITGKWTASPPFRGLVDFQPCAVDVRSRGRVRLACADPAAAPIVDPDYLACEREVRVLVEGIRFVRALAATRALERFGLVGEVRPGPDVRSDRELAEYVRASVETSYHPAGTCRMGVDGAAVVDPELRVHGLQGLRVADASIMPSLVNGNTNGPTFMIAERAADLMRGRVRDDPGG
ncbi:MAG TPA: FAD-dependent oxidoreductase [Vicinamibacteria bacterium]|nr:FAD-dependent oxidoreductase [Vicinamibacteria bacterium]